MQLKPGVTAEQASAAYQVLANEPLIRLLGNKIQASKAWLNNHLSYTRQQSRATDCCVGH